MKTPSLAYNSMAIELQQVNALSSRSEAAILAIFHWPQSLILHRITLYEVRNLIVNPTFQ